MQMVGQDWKLFTHNGGGTHSQTAVLTGGKFGVGTTSPVQQLSVQNLLYVGAGGVTGMGTATSTFQGDIKITGKLDVSTIDPVYTIDGVKYATYGHSTIGIKEEMTMLVEVTERDASGKYVASINFSDAEEGSDLWLFYQVTQLDWKSLVVSLTPSFEGQVYYKKDAATNTLKIISTEPGEVSMRLIADRYDAEKWPNLRPDQDGDTSGTHVIESKR